MIKIYFSSNAGKNISAEIDLSGNKQDFSELTKNLNEFLISELLQIRIDADAKISPFPYAKMLESLIVLKSENPVLVTVIDEKILKVEGSVECLKAFVSNIEYVEVGHHIHYEYYDGNEWILPDSIPLIISSKSSN
ncbi:MAG TPA: hypothetical protein PKY59_10660 [Pyrinomonadaceae bacterium]|nr:hypothetical protein [Pyrinomonadaceae bacterium]